VATATAGSVVVAAAVAVGVAVAIAVAIAIDVAAAGGSGAQQLAAQQSGQRAYRPGSGGAGCSGTARRRGVLQHFRRFGPLTPVTF